MIGGYDGTNNLSNFEIFNPTMNTWSSGQNIPSSRRYPTAITVDGKIYLIGGRINSTNELNQVLSLSSTNHLDCYGKIC